MKARHGDNDGVSYLQKIPRTTSLSLEFSVGF
jgi:hypothetical protein